MTSFFQRLVNPGGKPESGPRRLALAAFGKHPGWNDHIPGIGVETESLAHVKQALYVGGIGGRIDAGVWKNLEAGKRIEGFDHVFLWLRAGHVILGRMDSSEDGLRRKEYPLVLCVDAEGVSPATLLSGALPELDRLGHACRATTSAGTVADECRMAQDRLRALLTGESARPNEPALGLEARRRFLEHRDLGPDRVGLLRLLHELGNPGKTAPEHLRIPLAENSRTTALVLWAEFLRNAVSASVPLLLISRPGVEWLDVIVGEPVSDDFFCLQASPAALPLASQVPYDLSPALRKRLQELETKFTGVKAEAASPPAAMLDVRPSPIAAPPKSGTAPPARKGLFRFFVVLGLVMLVGGLAAVWWFSGNRGSPAPPKPLATSTTAAPVPAEVVKPDQTPPSHSSPPIAVEIKPKPEPAIQRPAVEKVPTETKPTVSPAAPVDEKHKAEDANLAQIAVAGGNYARVIEICQQWPGASPFKELLSRVAVETNQLRLAGESLQAGNYDSILTNQFPENPRFVELRTTAEAEKKILEQAAAEFAAGSHALLQNEAVLNLKAKPPFQKLIQATTTEAEQLRQAQAFMAGNKPEAAMNLLDANKLEKPPFAKIRQWAATELNRLTGLRREQQQAEAWFQQGDYARALNLCNQRSGLPAFDALAKKIGEEQGALTDAEQKLAVGDYASLAKLDPLDYRTKPPFAELLRQRNEEQKSLEELNRLKQAGSWAEVLTRLNTLEAGVSGKPPFAELRAWAKEKFRADEELKGKSPVWLDTSLEVMLVRFNLVSPVKTTHAKQERALVGFLGTEAKNYYLSNVTWLRFEYEKRKWLDKARTQKLKDLESTIRYRD